MLPEWLRVKDAKTGHEVSVTREHFDAAPTGALIALDKPGADPGNYPYPAKFKTTVAAAAASKSGPKADPKKEID